MSNSFIIIGQAPSIAGIAMETDDYAAFLAKTGEDGPTGYVVRNKHTDVYEYVARSYAECVQAMTSYQVALDALKKQVQPVLKTVN